MGPIIEVFEFISAAVTQGERADFLISCRTPPWQQLAIHMRLHRLLPSARGVLECCFELEGKMTQSSCDLLALAPRDSQESQKPACMLGNDVLSRQRPSAVS